MEILITGAAGFIGYHVSCLMLRNGHKLTLIDNHSRNAQDRQYVELIKNKNVRYYNMDLTERNNWAQISGDYDAVFHFAAVNGTKYFYEKPYEVLRVNILSLVNLLEWCSNKGRCGKIIWTSSSEAYAGLRCIEIPTSEDTPIGVDDIMNPRYSYGISKIAGETILINYCRENSLPFTIVRPHNIYGPRMGYEHVIPEFIGRIIRREKIFKIFGGQQTRAFCYIDDFVSAMNLILNSKTVDREIINIGNDQTEIKIDELAKILFDISKHYPDVRYEDGLAGSVLRRKPCLDKAKKLLGYNASVGLQAGLIQTYKWYADEGKKNDSSC